MQILPLKFIREEDKKSIGLNLYNLAKLNHLGLPVVESVIVIPPTDLFHKVLNKYLKHNFNINDHLNNIKTEFLNIPTPESLQNLEIINTENKAKANLDINKLWQNLLEKWVYEIMSKIERKEKNLFNLTPQLIIFSANFSAFGMGFFDEDREHAVIKISKGQLDFQTSSEIENLILLGNKKLLLPQVYHWGIEDGKIKIVKVTPYTQSFQETPKSPDTPEKIISIQNKSKSQIKTATKIILNYQNEILNSYNADGVLLNLNKIDNNIIDSQISKITQFDSQSKFIFSPDLDLTLEKSLEFAKSFLFFRNKKKLDTQIVLPQTFSVDEFLNLKREYASLGIYSKGSLKIWKKFNTVADFLNLDEYLDAGFDGAIIDLDKISKIICGLDGETIFKNSRKDNIQAIEKFFRKNDLSKIIKNHKSVLITGTLAKNEELLNYFINIGVWGIAFENSEINPFKEHINFLEKQTVKKLTRSEIQH